MNKLLITDKVQNFIDENISKDIYQIILKGSPFEGITAQELANQIFGRLIMSKKTPSFVKRGIVYPAKKNIEQTSSEQTAKHKQTLIKDDYKSIIDLTGGFGIDLFYLSEKKEEVYYCDTNQELSEMVAHNFKVHEKKGKIFHINGIDYLKEVNKTFDLIYLDPDRRIENKRVFYIEDCTPNIIEHWPLLLAKSNEVMVKLSPMIDLKYALNNLPHCKQIHVIAIKQDVKELVIIAEKEFKGTCEIVATCLNDKGNQTFTSSNQTPISITEIGDFTKGYYLYEPFNVLLKAQLHDQYAQKFGLKKLDKNSHLYFSNCKVDAPLCKRFKIIASTSLKAKELKKIIPSKKANVVCRNFHMKPEEIFKTLKFKQGGIHTIFCFKINQKAIVLVSEKD